MTKTKRSKVTAFMNVQRILKTNRTLEIKHYYEFIETCKEQIEKRKQSEIDRLLTARKNAVKEIDKQLKKLGYIEPDKTPQQN